MEASPPPRRALKRSASTASLLTPPRTYRRRGRGRSRGSCDSDSDGDNHRSKRHDSSDEEEATEPEGKRRVVKKRRLTTKTPQNEEDDEDKFWGGELPQVDDTKASSSRSKKPLLYQRFQSQSTGGTVSSEQGLVSPPPSHRKPAVPPAPVPGSPSPATTVSLPTTPQPKSKHKRGGSDSRVGLLRDSPSNPFVATPTPTGADDSDQSPSVLPQGDQSPTPAYDKPMVTYVFRGVKRVYQNPMFNHAKNRPLSPPPNSKLPVEHPEFSPDPSCKPTLLFPEAHKKRKAKKAASASSAKRSKKAKDSDSEDEGEDMQKNRRVKQPNFGKALTLDDELKKVAKKAKAPVEDDPFC